MKHTVLLLLLLLLLFPTQHIGQVYDTTLIKSNKPDNIVLQNGINIIISPLDSIIGLIQDGEKTGEWRYYSNKNLTKIATYTRGMLDGPYMEFFQNGKEKVVAYFLKSQLFGSRVEFHPNGNLLEISYTDSNGNLTSLRRVYTDSGKLIYDQNWPTIDSLWFTNAQCGNKWQDHSLYIADDVIFNCNEWYPDGNKKITCNRIIDSNQNILHFAYYLQDGSMKIKGAYVYNCKKGVCCWKATKAWYWYENGKLIKQEEFH